MSRVSRVSREPQWETLGGSGRKQRDSVAVRAQDDGQTGLLPRFSGDGLPTKAALVALWAAYMWFVLLTPDAPGKEREGKALSGF